MAAPQRIVRAWLEAPCSGIIELERNWTGKNRPRFTLGSEGPVLSALAPAPGLPAGRAYGYFLDREQDAISFVLPLEPGCDIDTTRDKVYLAGDFNGWQDAVGKGNWQLQPAELDGGRVLMWKGDAAPFLGGGKLFKFVTGEFQWLVPPDEAPNAVRDHHGNVNRLLDPHRTGWHLWRFTVDHALSLSEAWTVGWSDASGEPVPLLPGRFFYELKTSLPLGALVGGGKTVFRIFAPRARSVTLCLLPVPARPELAPEPEPKPDGVQSARKPEPVRSGSEGERGRSASERERVRSERQPEGALKSEAEPATEASTELLTEPRTEAPTESRTEPATEPRTESPIEPPTESPTGPQPPAERDPEVRAAKAAPLDATSVQASPGVPPGADEPERFRLTLRADAEGATGVWEREFEGNLHGRFYWYAIDGVRSAHGPNGFDPTMRVLDPYALATMGREGPGIVIDQAWMGRGDTSFATPAWHDLVMVEAHVRDLAANAPVAATAAERYGFTGLRKWVESDDFYLHQLGVNCVELQPVHEFDNVTADEYHWGYMTNNFFAPESGYALEPEKASGVRELQALVAAFHRRGMAVVLDVVFNHVGVPAHLMFVDKLYYFELDANGALTNWSGCGNDLRARSAMARRLIIDSCVHYMEAYGIDGFRFDLAELLGVDVLREIEVALKKARPSVILIAEPWSFRGHIAGALRDTGWASWNDGYRDFLREYVHGNGAPERMEYFLRGSPWYFAKWPAQTINYTESHDDRTWVDMITENPGYNGFVPRVNDVRRTQLMAALLFMSLGIPMLSAGQDFLRSKHGVSNSYQRGDLNAFDYRRLYRHLATHVYFADWIAFRRGTYGRLLRQWTRPTEGFFQFVSVKGSPALAVVYNADFSQGQARLLFMINPTLADLAIPVGANIAGRGHGEWSMVADQDRFYLAGTHGARRPVEAELWAPALSSGLWLSE